MDSFIGCKLQFNRPMFAFVIISMERREYEIAASWYDSWRYDFTRPGRSPERPVAGIRRRMGPCFATTRRPGRSDPGGKVRLAPGARRAIHQRGLHAHCAGELPFAEYHGP